MKTAPRYRPRLKHAPVTQQAPYDPENPPASATSTMTLSMRDPRRLPLPRVSLHERGIEGDWEARRELLNSGPVDKAFVAEVETDGSTYLRFGDGQLGLRPASGIELLATYRVGNGTAGNIGAKTLAHIVTAEAVADNGVTNFLPARGGVNPETIEEVDNAHRAPFASRNEPLHRLTTRRLQPGRTLPRPAISTCNARPRHNAGPAVGTRCFSPSIA